MRRSSAALRHHVAAIAGAAMLSIGLPSPAHAAAGDLDDTFRSDGTLTTDFGGHQDIGYPIALQPDGKIIVAGESGLDANPKFALARYNSNGSLDTSFGGDGKITTDFTSGEDVAYGVAVQADGKIVAAGTSGGYSRFALARYNPNGSLDTSFGGDGKVTTDFTPNGDYAYGMGIQADGKIVAAGNADVTRSDSRFAVARYNANGSLDATFGGDGKVTTDLTSYPDDGLAMAIQADQKIVMVGGAGFGAPNEKFGLVRYNTNGSLDATFGGDGKVTTDFGPQPDVAFGVAIQSNGKIVAAGGSSLGPSNNPKFALARFNVNGSLDGSFGGDGKRTTDFSPGDDDAYSVAIQADGKIVAAGQASSRNAKFALARYNANGSLDTTFGGDGKRTTDLTDAFDAVFAVLVQPDGKILAAGAAGLGGHNWNFALARYLDT
jgi:uncharacterized delta-60 repeat protein